MFALRSFKSSVQKNLRWPAHARSGFGGGAGDDDAHLPRDVRQTESIAAAGCVSHDAAGCSPRRFTRRAAASASPCTQSLRIDSLIGTTRVCRESRELVRNKYLLNSMDS